jgi:hypothetical protein
MDVVIRLFIISMWLFFTSVIAILIFNYIIDCNTYDALEKYCEDNYRYLVYNRDYYCISDNNHYIELAYDVNIYNRNGVSINIYEQK